MACCEETASELSETHNDRAVASGPHQQGYDYDFVPALDAKYECPICLLCQREPTQTTCGHRFCRDCILTWLKRESQRCPEDNSPITEADVFSDNFAKREILCLRAHCPNAKHGCQVTIQLSHMDEHLVTCDYRTVACPGGCPMLLPQADVDEHLAKECLHRFIECSLCQADFPLHRQQAHFDICPMVSLSCEFCRESLPRRDLARHADECPQAVIRCPFSDVGCDGQFPRSNLDAHFNSSTQLHLRLLGKAHGRLTAFVSKLADALDRSKPFNEWPLRASIASDAAASEDVGVEQLTFRGGGGGDPPGKVGDAADPKENAAFDGVVKAVPPERSLLSSAEGLMKELFQRNVRLEQRHREQELKMGTLRQHVAECETQVALLLERVGSTTSEARFCNGVYLWKLEGFARLIQEARSLGHSRLVHSPGFYTSAFGYRVCLRLNIVTKEHNNVRFVSLFIHLMQGEYDESLDWPFTGDITFSILDASEQRHHISETMTTKPGLVAFQRPTSERNPKGFGYMEFVAVDTLLAGGRYVRNGSVLIKAAIKVTQGGNSGVGPF